MSEHRFFLTRIFSYQDRVEDSFFIREDTIQRKPAFWHILRSEWKSVQGRSEDTSSVTFEILITNC